MTAVVSRLRLLPRSDEGTVGACVAVRWPDGSRMEAPGYACLLQQIRDLQWEEMGRRSFRGAMAHRAAVWSGTKISTRGSSRRFVRELARAGIFELEP